MGEPSKNYLSEAAPPPPPPPALTSSLPQPEGEQSTSDRTKLILAAQPLAMSQDELISEVLASVKRSLESREINTTQSEALTWVSVFHPVQSLLQDGPMCGLVALSMAASKLAPAWLSDASLDNTDARTFALLAFARARRFSEHGEMLSAEWLASLAREYCGLQAQCCPADVLSDPAGLVKQLCAGKLLLVPYDCYHNHTPFLATGHKAHWALVTGVLQAHSVDCAMCMRPAQRSSCYSKDSTTSDAAARHCVFADEDASSPVCSAATLETLPACTCTAGAAISPNQTYVLARQGKSRYVGIWNLMELSASNAQLTDFGSHPSKAGLNGTPFIEPEGSIRAGLCNKVVWLSSS